MPQELSKKLEDWKWIQSLPFDVLNMLTDDQLSLAVGKNMGTLGEQFRHMIRVRFQYAEAITTKRISDVIEQIDPQLATSKTGLIELWEKANQKLIDALSQSNTEDLEKTLIDASYWKLESVTIHDALNMLMDHETLHNGQIIVYLRTHDLKFPESWKVWGL